MNSSPRAHAPARVPRPALIGLVIGWTLIVAKCAVAPWLLHRWSAPFAPGWIVIPTLVFATLISLLVLTHDWSEEQG